MPIPIRWISSDMFSWAGRQELVEHYEGLPACSERLWRTETLRSPCDSFSTVYFFSRLQHTLSKITILYRLIITHRWIFCWHRYATNTYCKPWRVYIFSWSHSTPWSPFMVNSVCSFCYFLAPAHPCKLRAPHWKLRVLEWPLNIPHVHIPAHHLSISTSWATNTVRPRTIRLIRFCSFTRGDCIDYKSGAVPNTHSYPFSRSINQSIGFFNVAKIAIALTKSKVA